MTGQRPVYAAGDLFGDRHRVGARHYTVTDPEGRQFDLCSGFCLVEYATLGALPADANPGTLMTAGNAHNGTRQSARVPA